MAEKRATHQRARDAAQERMLQTARSARERGREIRCAALDMPWARCAPARLARETILSGFFGPVMAWYVNRKTEGREVFAGVRRCRRGRLLLPQALARGRRVAHVQHRADLAARRRHGARRGRPPAPAP